MKNILIFVFIAFTTLAFAQRSPMSSAEEIAFKGRIEKDTRELKTIRTDFTQNKKLSFLSKEIESTGKMYLNAQGHLKWVYLQPNKYAIIFKDNVILIDDNGKKSKVDANNEVFKKISHLIAGSVSGKLFDDKEFSIKYFKEGKNSVAELIPHDKSMKKYISVINLFFGPSESTVSKVKLIEPSGDYTEITFVNKETNVQIDSAVFSH